MSAAGGPDPVAGTAGAVAAVEAAEDVVARLRMEPIPEEGAWFAPGPRTDRMNAITVLLTSHPDGFSAMHRLAVDEGWQWLGGAPATLLRLGPDRAGARDRLDAAQPQLLVPRGTWMGATTRGAWTLLACWCAPAFLPEHFELGDPAELASRYPDHAADIAALTRDEPVGRMR